MVVALRRVLGPGTEVRDRAGIPVGTVVRVHRYALFDGAAARPQRLVHREEVLEVRADAPESGATWYIPGDAVRAAPAGGAALRHAREELAGLGWADVPAFLYGEQRPAAG